MTKLKMNNSQFTIAGDMANISVVAKSVELTTGFTVDNGGYIEATNAALSQR